MLHTARHLVLLVAVAGCGQASETPDLGDPAGDGGGTIDDGGGGGDANNPSVGPMPGGTLSIPTSHPRLWWNAQRIATAQAWYSGAGLSAPASVGSAERAIDAAMHHVLTGDAVAARRAIDWALTVTVNTSGVASDAARWDGEAVILVYDWCHAAMTAGERSTMLTRWNGWLAALDAKDWGGIGMEGNNYYLGYFRNALLWALATYHDNPEAQSFLDHALVTRWKDSYLPYALEHGKGGIMHEGSAYGRRVLRYFTVPLVSSELLGRNLWDESPFFRESVYWLIYSTTPGVTQQKSGASTHPLYETWPYNEDERWYERDPVNNTAQTTLGDYLVPLVAHWQGLPIAGHAQRFLDLTGAAPESRMVRAVRTTAPPVAFDALPLDYYTQGLGMAYAKTSWNDGFALNAQVSVPVGVGHSHLDAGSFQLWRKGRWLTRETVGYTHQIAAYGSGTVDCRDPVGHNVLLYGGKGTIDHFHHRPTALRMESAANHYYLAMDLTGAYEVETGWEHREDEVGNPAAGRTVRELVFIRPLDTLVVFDRMESVGASAATVNKTFLVHFESTPTFDGASSYLGTSGDQQLRVTTVVPQAVARRVVVEGGTVGQQRVEIETNGAAVSHFLHVLQGREQGGADLTINLATTATQYTLTLSHPTRGTATVTFERGIQSTGGSFGYAATGTPTPTPLRTTVQGLKVDYDGVSWN
jgi:hypothetical protein